ncbi:nucleoside 2-deoxyribosyltransferase [Bifidobacterium stellenboschense]|uniref:Nucleoside 2-deoxyribosyltransferase n=2 Tax=Bifidobacterium stellenboschense TaxID=762211 RepID=A0A087E0L0_9BIFI|nr:nucleoside 2-deoxyribosyltransferase [Bifidobacterium stellenboschense]
MVGMNDTNNEDGHIDFYVAGPFFDPEQAHSMEHLEQVLEDHGKTLFKPRFASQIEEVGPEGCFTDDIGGIDAADAVIANLMDEDAGTMFEIGYAYALGKPVYGYRDELTPMDRVNLMVAQAVKAVFNGPEDLAKYLETGEHEEVDYIQF